MKADNLKIGFKYVIFVNITLVIVDRVENVENESEKWRLVCSPKKKGVGFSEHFSLFTHGAWANSIVHIQAKRRLIGFKHVQMHSIPYFSVNHTGIFREISPPR